MKIHRFFIPFAAAVWLLFFTSPLSAQDRFVNIENQLKNLVVEMPGLEDKVELSVNGVSIEEFIRGMAVTNKLNISVDPSLDTKIINNFSGVSVMDVLLFLAKEHELQISFTGNIISVTKYIPPVQKQEALPPRKPQLSYIPSTDLLSLDLKNDSLDEVAKEITTKTGKNVILEAGIRGRLVNGFIKDMPFDNALEKFAFANSLLVEKTADNFYLLSAADVPEDNAKPATAGRRGNTNQKEPSSAEIELTATSRNNISIKAIETPILEIIKAVSEELDISYYINSNVTGNTTIFIKNTTYETLLENLLNASNYTYQKEGEVYIIGERKIEKLRETQVVQLQHRSVEHVMEHIPAELRTGVDIKEFPDLNSLILSGSKPNIEEIALFLKTIDKVVPVILIEVMLIDYSNRSSTTAGVRYGIGTEPAAESSGGLGADGNFNYSFNAESVNNIIQGLNGNNFLNLGKVTPNFYLSIHALEENGLLRVRSTPKLATLNGTEAVLTIGNTEYYAINSNSFVGTQQPVTVTTTQYQSVNANLTVSIKPFVSGDEQITLDISVEQSDFTAKPLNGPPPSVTRSFTSLLRVKNGEMILLGGLEEKSISNSGSGIPLLSKIPIIRWFFGTRSRTRGKSKLNIFIKPTVIY